MSRKKESQWSKIFDYMLLGRTITPMEALRKFRCNRLAARIKDIEFYMQAKVSREWFVTKSKKYVKRYSL